MELLDHIVILFKKKFQEIPYCLPSQLHHFIFSTVHKCRGYFLFFNSCHRNEYKVTSHCGFDLQPCLSLTVECQSWNCHWGPSDLAPKVYVLQSGAQGLVTCLRSPCCPLWDNVGDRARGPLLWSHVGDQRLSVQCPCVLLPDLGSLISLRISVWLPDPSPLQT